MTTIDMNKFMKTFNEVDSKLYEISKIQIGRAHV